MNPDAIKGFVVVVVLACAGLFLWNFVQATPPIGGPDVIINGPGFAGQALVTNSQPPAGSYGLAVYPVTGGFGGGGGSGGVIVGGSLANEAWVSIVPPASNAAGLNVRHAGPLLLDPASQVTAIVSSVKPASTAPQTTDTALVTTQSPVPAPVCTSKVAINQTTSTTVITGTAAQFLYICSIVLMSGGAQNISITEGIGSTCATGEQAVLGGTTPSMAVAANTQVPLISGIPWLKTAAAGNNLCLEQSAASNVSGVITYVSAS